MRKNLVPGLIVALLLLAGLCWFFMVQREAVRKITYVIPPGTGQEIEAGRPSINLPDEVVLTLGIQDTIIIENQDDVMHTFGPFVVGPGSTLTKRFDAPVIYNSACTFHQDQQMRLVVKPAPWDILNW